MCNGSSSSGTGRIRTDPLLLILNLIGVVVLSDVTHIATVGDTFLFLLLGEGDVSVLVKIG